MESGLFRNLVSKLTHRSMSFTKNITKIKCISEFENSITTGTVLVDFSAQWCTPCTMILPHIKEFSKIYKNLKIVTVDVDEFDEFCEQCGITVVPTYHLYIDGVKIDELVGGTKKQLDEFLVQHCRK